MRSTEYDGEVLGRIQNGDPHDRPSAHEGLHNAWHDFLRSITYPGFDWHA
jgi:hypothetical protein